VTFYIGDRVYALYMGMIIPGMVGDVRTYDDGTVYDIITVIDGVELVRSASELSRTIEGIDTALLRKRRVNKVKEVKK
jgi:hypothetical protein